MNQVPSKIQRNFITIDDFLNKYHIISFPNIKNGMIIDFNFGLGDRSHKILPILQIALPDHAKTICNIFKSAYDKTYPYKKLEDKKEIKYMIKSQQYMWFIFKTLDNEIVGCVGAKLELDKKKGYIFGFAIKKEYQGKIDNLKTWLCFIYYLWNFYKNKILIWTSEVRTYSKTPQYAESLVGLKPVGFLPNKDIFYNQVESEFFTIIHDKDVFDKYRSQKVNKIIRQVLVCYIYSNKRYNLGNIIIKNPNLNLNKEKILDFKNNIITKALFDKYDNSLTTMRIKNTSSYFQYQFNLYSNNIENIEYFIDDLEELVVYLRKLILFIKNHNIRYAECYVSARCPKHQKLFYQAGFIPRGYLPCLQFNKETNSFYDVILFNYYKQQINPNLESNLILETKELFRISQGENRLENSFIE